MVDPLVRPSHAIPYVQGGKLIVSSEAKALSLTPLLVPATIGIILLILIIISYSRLRPRHQKARQRRAHDGKRDGERQAREDEEGEDAVQVGKG